MFDGTILATTDNDYADDTVVQLGYHFPIRNSFLSLSKKKFQTKYQIMEILFVKMCLLNEKETNNTAAVILKI